MLSVFVSSPSLVKPSGGALRMLQRLDSLSYDGMVWVRMRGKDVVLSDWEVSVCGQFVRGTEVDAESGGSHVTVFAPCEAEVVAWPERARAWRSVAGSVVAEV